MVRRTTRKGKKNGAATCSHNENVFSSKIEYGDDWTRAKTATQRPALNEKPRYCWLKSDKMDGSDENGTVKICGLN